MKGCVVLVVFIKGFLYWLRVIFNSSMPQLWSLTLLLTYIFRITGNILLLHCYAIITFVILVLATYYSSALIYKIQPHSKSLFCIRKFCDLRNLLRILFLREAQIGGILIF